MSSTMKGFAQRIANQLVDDGLITKEQVDEIVEASKEDGKRFVDVLIERSLVTQEDMLVSTGRCLGIAPVNLRKFRVEQELVDLIPKEFGLTYKLVPVSRLGKKLFVAMADPLNILALDDLKRMLPDFEIIPMISAEKAISDALNNINVRFKGSLDEILKNTEGTDVEVKKEQLSEINLDEAVMDAEQGPVIKVVNLLLIQAIRDRASDIHIEPFEREMRVRNRIDGVLYDYTPPPKAMQNAIASRIKIMSNLNIAERRLPQDGRFRIRLAGKEIDFRVSVLPCAHGEKIVMRVLDKGGLTSSLETMGLGEKAYNDFRYAINQPHGMILMTGPTGSGKTTTLYTVLQQLNTPDVNIITVEDPIEYQLLGINQVQVKPEIGLTFANGLRSILRQDPDIIMVGEIRDGETADIAVKAALTGHLVLSTLHTNDAAGAITRLVDMGVEPFLVSSSLILTCAQRLVRRICQNCKMELRLPPDALARMGLADQESMVFYKGAGCARCKNTGYWGRLALLEVLPVTGDIRQSILRNANASAIKQRAIETGMYSLRMAGIAKAREGLTTLEEVLRVTAADH